MIYWISTIVFIGYIVKQKKKRHLAETKSTKKFSSALITTAICFVVFCLSVTGVEWSRFAKQWNRVYIVNSFGLYTYQVNDIVQSIKPKINSLFGYDNAFKTFKEYYKEREQENMSKQDNEFTGIYKGRYYSPTGSHSSPDAVLTSRSVIMPMASFCSLADIVLIYSARFA